MEKIKKLDDAIKKLKTEYVGLDNILDRLGEAISTWYITPQVLERPCVVSLFGMSGTGKTSVIKELVKLLGVEENTMFFDCGTCRDDNASITGNICDALGIDREDYNDCQGRKDNIFVFDEFQYARTIDETGSEDIKPSLRPIWQLMDSGIVDITDIYDWYYNKFCAFVDDLVTVNPDIVVENNLIKDKDSVKSVLESLYFYYSREIPGITTDKNWPVDEKSEEDPYKPLNFLPSDIITAMMKKLNRYKKGMGMEYTKKVVNGRKTVGEIRETLEYVRSILQRPKTVDCSKSLVICIGNIDEAFRISDDMSPDIDADTFHAITERVTKNDIKEALKKRFRPEQIARLGNNLILYPTLGSKEFKQIIKNETQRILGSFKEVKVDVTSDFYNLLYREGVYPSQGTRCVFSTINSILTPYLSKILIDGDGEKTALIDVKSSDPEFRIPEVDIVIKFGSGKEKTYKQKLELGSLRYPLKRKRRYISSIHEAGHAIIYLYTTGQAPINIVGVDTDHGGFCMTYDENSEGEIDSREDVDKAVMIDLGGYCAEHLTFDDKKCLMGSSDDLGKAWGYFSDCVYRCGYFEPLYLEAYEPAQNSQVPGGMDDKDYVRYWNGEKFIGQEIEIRKACRMRFNDLRKKVDEILGGEKKLLVKLGLKLGEVGSMKGDEFMKYVKEFGQITQDELEVIRKNNDPGYYLKKLEEE